MKNSCSLNIEMTICLWQFSLQEDWDLSLWKDVNEAIGWGKRSIYVIKNTNELEGGKLYQFHWIRDEVCTQDN